VPREAVDHLLPGNDLHLRCERVRRVLSVPTDAPPESVATDLRCFLPDWAYGFLPATTDSEQIVGWLQLRPPVWIRRQGVTHDQLLAALTEDGLEPRRHPALDTAYCLGHPEPDLYRTGAFREGWFEIQDLASQIIGYVCRAEAGQRWWDACAGGGGKSLQLAADMDGRGTVVATDIREHKLDDLRRRARRAGLHNIQTRSWDGRKPPGKAGAFDGVLVDAPCSCSGTWRRNPDGRWRVRPEDVAELAAVQGRILDAAAPGVRPGGRLVYATCSMFELENHGVVRRFLERHPEFRLGTLRNPILRDSGTGTVTPCSSPAWNGRGATWSSQATRRYTPTRSDQAR
jgi:16S rRNA (cytosine967-C5)-methyltransferase